MMVNIYRFMINGHDQCYAPILITGERSLVFDMRNMAFVPKNSVIDMVLSFHYVSGLRPIKFMIRVMCRDEHGNFVLGGGECRLVHGNDLHLVEMGVMSEGTMWRVMIDTMEVGLESSN